MLLLGCSVDCLGFSNLSWWCEQRHQNSPGCEELTSVCPLGFPILYVFWGLVLRRSHVPACTFVPGAQHRPWARHRGTHPWFSKRESCCAGGGSALCGADPAAKRLLGGEAAFPPLCSSHLSCRTKARAGSSQRQHQSAAKDLTLSPEVSNPATIQVTYLPSSQKSKRAKHFLELKSFKDNYNTLESTL